MAHRALFVDGPVDRDRYELGFSEAVCSQFDVTALRPLEFAEWRPGSLDEYEVVFVYRRFAELEAAPSIEWGDYRGRRVMVDHDAFHDFTSWSDRPGRWRAAFARHGFDTLVCSGVRSYEHFTSHGIDTILLHKAVDPRRFTELGLDRAGLCFFGSPYRSRGALLRHLDAARLAVDRRTAPYAELNAVLNEYLGLVTTVRGADVRFGRLGRAVERVRPGTVLRYEPAAEPMAKHFEAAAAGCAVITDWTPDLEPLGFVEGESVISFADFDEMVDRVRHYSDRPDDLRRIGAAAAQLCRERHTWQHRAVELEKALFG